MLKKKYNHQKQILVKANYKKKFIESILLSSLSKNQYIEPIDRLSYFAQDDYIDNLFFRFSTYQKLHCLISLSPKVHSRTYYYSRFFINKQLNNLVMGNTLK